VGHRLPVISRLHSIGRRGFTLLEGLLAAVVLAILVLGVCGTLSESYKQSEFTAANAAAVSLARQLADEITWSPYTQISSYNNYSDKSTLVPLLEGGSLNVTGSDNYTRSVTVVSATPSIDPSPAVPTDFAIVTVKVTAPNGQIVAIPQFVANYPIQR